MTVAELIEALSKMPQDMPVITFRAECMNFCSVDEVNVVDADPMSFDGEYLDGRYARHNVERAVVLR